MHKYQIEFPTSRSSNFKHDSTRRQGVKHPSRNHPVHEQTEVVETAASVGRNRILISRKRRGDMERRGGRDEQPLEDSFEFSFTGDHSRDQTGSFTDRSPLLPQAVLPFHLVLSVIRPSSLRWNSHCLPPCLSLSYRFRGRPTDSYFSENSFNVLTGSIFEYRNVFVFHNIIVVPPWINASFIILTMDRDTMERYFSSYTITIIYFHQCG